MKNITVIIIVFSITVSCNKKLLKKSPSENLTIPAALIHLKGLLNNQEVMGITPAFGEQGSDDHYLLPDFYEGLPQTEKNIYTWQDDSYAGAIGIADWIQLYRQVLQANVVLEELSKLDPGNNEQQLYNEVMGSALFMRSYCFFGLAQIFAPVYNQNTAETDMGIPIPLSSDQNVIFSRASIKDSYNRIINDLLLSVPLLPANVEINKKNFPSKAAGYGFLARTFLSMRDYTKAGLYADSCLQLHDSLIDYNTVNENDRYPVLSTNRETLFQSSMIRDNRVIKAKIALGTIVDSNLYKSYHPDDRRKIIFFGTNPEGQHIFKTSYMGSTYVFSGIATDEIYLIRAECNARKNNVAMSLQDINFLLQHRYKTGTYIPYTYITPEALLQFILDERRKELIFRGIRWTDLRRLNKEEAEITLTRVVNGSVFQLPPNDKRYTLLIPADALEGSAIKQNDR